MGRMANSRSTEPRIHYRVCPLCEATCGLEIQVADGKVQRIRGDAADVFSHGFVCPKGATLKDLHEDPDRLRAPRIRDGEIWREVTFDEAFAEVERRLLPILEEYGRNAVAVYLGNANVHNLAGGMYLRPLLKALGTRSVFSASTVDQMPRHVSSGLLYGSPGLIPVPDIDRTDYLLMLGANPWVSNGSLCTAPNFPGRLRALRARGGKLVVVDPRRTKTTDESDLHISIRPGSDVYFLLALCQVLFAEGRIDLGELAPHVDGLEIVEDLVRPFDPEAVSQHTGISAETTRQVAREIADAPSAAVYGRIGANTVVFGALTSWAADLVTLLTGNLDRPGGLMWALAAHSRASKGEAGGRGWSVGRWKSRVRGLREVMGEFPVATLADEIETEGEGQVRALMTIGGNPALSTPNSGRLEGALGKLDFMVSVDPYLNETTRHADVIIPPPSPLERSHYDLAFYGLAVRNVANYSEQIFETDAPQESEILSRLALIALGKGAAADATQMDDLLVGGALRDAVANAASPLEGADPDELQREMASRPGPERLLDVLLRAGPYGDRLSLKALEAKPHGIDLGALEPRLPGLLRTASGKIELAPEPIVRDFDRLHDAFAAAPAPGLVLIGRRHLRSNNSWLHNVDRLVRGKERCTLQIHPEDAEKHGLRDGGLAVIRSRAGSIEAPVEISEDLRVGVVSLPHGWGHDRPGTEMAVAAAHPGVNSNALTDELELDVLSGNAVLNGIPVEVASIG